MPQGADSQQIIRTAVKIRIGERLRQQRESLIQA